MRELTPAPERPVMNASQIDAMDAAALRARIQKAIADSYTIESEIGRGGMAVVYAARETKLRRVVALKVLPPDLAFRADVRARFVREAQTAAGLNHPNIVPIYAVDERDGMVFFAMSLIHGETLATRLIREPRPTLAVVESVLVQVADALAYAHSAGVVHRDIKPDNILIDNETGRATVTDFGIARALEGGARLTQTGIAVGTPAFMSPEQATGDREIDGRSDVYSLGIVGYLMLAGRLPFEASSTPAMLVKHVSERPYPLREYRPDAPPALVAVIERCLEKKPDDRWPNAALLRDAVKKAVAAANVVSNGNATGAANGFANAGIAEWRTGGPRMHAALPAAPPPLPRGNDAPRDPSQPRSEAEWRNQYPLGKRAEDWTPPMPPPLPMGGSKRDFREWRREVRTQRAESQRAWKQENRQLAREQDQSRNEMARAAIPPETLIHRFRGQALRSVVFVSGLAFINIATNVDFPWVLFPAFGMTLSLLARYSRLREQGITMGEILAGEPNEQKRAARAAVNDPATLPARAEKAVMGFRRRARWALGFGAISLVSVAVGAPLDFEPLIVPFAAGGVLAAINALRAVWFDRRRLKKLGLTMGDAWSDRWKAKSIPVDNRPRDVRLRERAEGLVGMGVLESSLGKGVRSAVDDHFTIKETSSKLTDADRMLVPDVDPTADALMERIAAIATSLERLERDMPGDAMADVSERIAAVERERESAPDRERRLTLLQRQKNSMQDLVNRRETLQRQFESAAMALRSLRLDMVKLSALGMGALADVTNATQEARALSGDIARALYAAEEVRKL